MVASALHVGPTAVISRGSRELQLATTAPTKFSGMEREVTNGESSAKRHIQGSSPSRRTMKGGWRDSKRPLGDTDITPSDIPRPVRRRAAWRALAIGLVAAAVIILLVLAVITLSNTSTVVSGISKAQKNHQGTLNSLQKDTTAIHDLAKKQADNSAVGRQILIVAGEAVASLEHDQQLLCQKFGITDCTFTKVTVPTTTTVPVHHSG